MNYNAEKKIGAIDQTTYNLQPAKGAFCSLLVYNSESVVLEADSRKKNSFIQDDTGVSGS